MPEKTMKTVKYGGTGAGFAREKPFGVSPVHELSMSL